MGETYFTRALKIYSKNLTEEASSPF